MDYKGASDLCLLQQHTMENSGSLMERKKEERIEWPFVSGGEKKKERKKRRTNKDLFPFSFVKWKLFRADWARPCYCLSPGAWCSACLCSEDTKGSCYFWRLKLLCSAEGAHLKMSDPWEKNTTVSSPLKLALRKQIWIPVHQFALEQSAQGYLGIDVSKNRCIKKEKIHPVFWVCSPNCLMSSPLSYNLYLYL